MQAKSTSALVNVGKQAFFKGDKVVMRDASDVKKDVWSDTFSVTTLSDYRTNLGAEPTALSNYILNDETIVKAEKSVRYGRRYIPSVTRSTPSRAPRATP